MKEAVLRLELLSATTFGRGDGVAGLIDNEVEHDDDGFPFLRGRTLKGLLAEASEDMVFALDKPGETKWCGVKENLFGTEGSGLMMQGTIYVGDAQLPKTLRDLILWKRKESRKKNEDRFHKDEVLAALTSIRRQTAMNEYGAPKHGSLRSMRIVLRGTVFESDLSFEKEPNEDELTLLACAVLGLRATGTGRNRGRGRLRAILNSEVFTRKYFNKLKSE